MTGLKETLIENIFFNLPKKSHMHDPLNIMVPDFFGRLKNIFSEGFFRPVMVKLQVKVNDVLTSLLIFYPQH